MTKGGEIELKLDQAIENKKVELFILEQRKAGVAFSKIGDMIGLSKSACYKRFRQACGLDKPLSEVEYGTDYVDGSPLGNGAGELPIETTQTKKKND